MKQNFQHHTQSIVESTNIGENTRIWPFVHILSQAIIGNDCNICENVFIENKVKIGNRVTIKNGVQIWDGMNIEDDVFIGPNVTFTNDHFPRSKKHQPKILKTVIKKGASIGANATLLPGLTIGSNAMIGAGTVVTRDVPPNAIVIGNPAKIRGYVPTQHYDDLTSIQTVNQDTSFEDRKQKVKGVDYIKLPEIIDIRGKLSFAEIGDQLPFIPKRYFLIYGVPNREVRGEHAHKELHEFLICVQGSCSVMVDDGVNREEFLLDSPTIGFHLPPMVWGVQYKYSHDAILLVLASDIYDADDYIRDYDEYISMVKS